MKKISLLSFLIKDISASHVCLTNGVCKSALTSQPIYQCPGCNSSTAGTSCTVSYPICQFDATQCGSSINPGPIISLIEVNSDPTVTTFVS